MKTLCIIACDVQYKHYVELGGFENSKNSTNSCNTHKKARRNTVHTFLLSTRITSWWSAFDVLSCNQSPTDTIVFLQFTARKGD